MSVPRGPRELEGQEGDAMDSEGLSKLLKRVNERICALRADSLDAHAEFFCECGHRDCEAPIELTPRSYLLGRGLFLLAPGHESPRGELRLPLRT